MRVRALGTMLWHQRTALPPDPPHTCPGDHLGRTPGGAEDRGQSRKVHALEDMSPQVCQAHSLSLIRNYHHQPRQEPEQSFPFLTRVTASRWRQWSLLKGTGSTEEASRIKEAWGQKNGWCWSRPLPPTQPHFLGGAGSWWQPGMRPRDAHFCSLSVTL